MDLKRTFTRLGAPMAVAMLVATGAVLAAPSAPVQAYGSAITITGRGNGHGDGLSQWGAYGYATSYGWDWHQILSHYYGGTTETAGDPATEVTVRLRGLDDRPFTAVVNARRTLRTNADLRVGTYGTVLAVSVGVGSYKVYGRADAVCPDTAVTGDLDRGGSGWSVVGSLVQSSTTGANRLEVTGGDAASTDRGVLAGVCQPSGTVKVYRGGIVVVDGTEAEHRVVNKVPVEQYLRGVVPRESPASWGSAGGGSGMHALRAQAVAARTYALAEKRYSYAQTCDTDSCQVYGGAATIAGPNDAVQVLEDSRSDTAVTDTATVTLRNGDGALAYAQFNSSSGGITSGANFASVEDLGDAVAANPHHRWTTTVARADIEAAYPAIGSLTNVDVTKRNGLGEWGGRVLSVVVRGTGGSVTVTGQAFANALGLRSTWFDLPAGCAGPTPSTTTPAPSLQAFHQVTPTRLVDTREGRNASVAPVAGGCVLALRPASLGSLPVEARAVSLNLTLTGPVGPGFATVYPCDSGLPLASSLNYRAGQTVANQITVPLDGNGEVCVYTHQKADLIVDLLGWFGPDAASVPGSVAGARKAAATAVAPGDHFTPVAPVRVTDTRDGTGGVAGRVGPEAVVAVQVVATGLVPASAKPSAVVLNVTATQAGLPGFLTAYACDATRPLASNVNPVPGLDVAAHVVAPVSADGRVCIYSHQPTHVVVDLLGWYSSTTAVAATTASGASNGAAPPGVPFEPLAPERLLDTRETGAGPLIGGSGALALTVAGAGGVPSGTRAQAVVLNVTATAASTAGFVTVYPCGAAFPLASNLNFANGYDVANMVTVPVGADGQVCLYANRTTHLVVDLAGWYGT